MTSTMLGQLLSDKWLDGKPPADHGSAMNAAGIMTEPVIIAELELALLDQAAVRGPDKSFCPSDVARALAGPHPDGWGPLMQPIRRIAVRLAKEGKLIITRKGKPVDPDDFRGVYRLGLPRED